MKTFLNAPIEVGIEITNLCNFRCIHCYASSGKPYTNELNFDEIRKLLYQLTDMKVFKIFIGGGEPFLHKDFIRILKLCKELGFFITTSTNGSYITKDIVETLKESEIAGVQVSLDGANKHTHESIRNATNTFEKTIQTIRILADNHIPLTIGHVVSKLNYKEMPELIELAIKLGVQKINIMDLQPAGFGLEYYEKIKLDSPEWLSLYAYLNDKKSELKGILEFEVQPNRFVLLDNNIDVEKYFYDFTDVDLIFINCFCARTRCIIDPRGEVFACELMRGKDASAGNIRDITFKEIWNGATIFQEMRNRPGNLQECGGCQFKKVCQGGCPAITYNIKRNIYKKDPRCFIGN